MQLDEVIEILHSMADPDKVALKWKKFGIPATNSLGIYHRELKSLTRRIGPDNDLALELFETGIYEARILCSKIYDPALITQKQMDRWVTSFDTWEICDSLCMGFFCQQ